MPMAKTKWNQVETKDCQQLSLGLVNCRAEKPSKWELESLEFGWGIWWNKGLFLGKKVSSFLFFSFFLFFFFFVILERQSSVTWEFMHLTQRLVLWDNLGASRIQSDMIGHPALSFNSRVCQENSKELKNSIGYWTASS